MQMPSMSLLPVLRQQGLRTSGWPRGLAAAALVVGAWAVSAPVQARDVYFSIGVNTPGVSMGVSNAPPVIYHPPAVVHYPPPVVHYPPPVVHYPQPVVVHPPHVVYPRPVLVYPQQPVRIGRPVVVAPQPIYHDRPRHPGYRDGYRRGDRHNRDQGPYYRY